MNQFEEITGSTIFEAYGLTEASPVTHATPAKGKRKPGSVGIALPSTDARIMDLESGTRELPAGEPGELVVKGPQIMKGYWNREEETAEALRDGWLYTGDIAYMDEDGYVFIVDRTKDMIISGGYNVYPREIDEVLYEHPKIADAVSIGVPDAYRGESVKVFVVVKPEETLTEAEVIAHCKEKLAVYKVPRLVEFRQELPKSMVGKVLRKELRAEESRTTVGEGKPG
jgi:long-chain acyl-CoA synthetase